MSGVPPLADPARYVGDVDTGGLRPLLAALPVIVLAFDAEGTCVLSEGGLLESFGIRPGEDVGRSLGMFFPRFPAAVHAVQRALTGETVYSRSASTGATLDVQWHPQCDVDGAVVGVLALGTKTAEADRYDSAARTEQTYRALLSAIPDQLVRLDADGTAVAIKPANDGTSLQLPVRWSPTPLVDLVTDDVAERLSTAAAAVIADQSERVVEAVITDATSHRYLEARLIPEGGERVLGFVREITGRRRAEDELREASKLEALGRLSAGVAHEINTPIQFVAHNVEFMRNSFATMHELLLAYRQALHSTQSLPWAERSARLQQAEAEHDVEFLLGEVPEAVNDTLVGIQRVSTIVTALKQFSHPSSDELQPNDVNVALRNAVIVSVNEHKLVADVAEDLAPLPPVLCNPGELTQVFLNLIVNAAQAVESMIVERGERGRIELSTRLDGDHVVVRIRDDGPGISYADQSRLFDAFFTTKVVGKGTGQGLTLARSIIVDRHGGTMEVHSVPGHGATFEVRLPVAGASPALVDAAAVDTPGAP